MTKYQSGIALTFRHLVVKAVRGVVVLGKLIYYPDFSDAATFLVFYIYTTMKHQVDTGAVRPVWLQCKTHFRSSDSGYKLLLDDLTKNFRIFASYEIH